MRALYTTLLAVAFCGLLAGCGSSTAANSPMPPLPAAMTVDSPPGSDMLTANIYAGDALSSMLLRRTSSGSGIVAASFVELDDLDQTSGFGRLASQQVGSRIGQHGFRVLEARIGAELRMDVRHGEFLLTRDSVRLLATEYEAHAALVGVYSPAGDKVFVSARVVRLADNAVLGAYEYYVPLRGEVSQLLSAGSGGRGGDAMWNRYGRRESAFGGNVDPNAAFARTAPAPKSAIRTPVAKPAAAQAVPAKDTPAPGGGYTIDPSAEPIPFPGGRRR